MIGSGNHVKSHLNFVTSSIPLVENSCKLEQLAAAEDEKTIVDQVFTCGEFILVNYRKLAKTGENVEMNEQNDG